MRRRHFGEIFRKSRSSRFEVRIRNDCGNITVELWRKSPEKMVHSERFEADSEGYMTTGQFSKAAWYAHGLVEALNQMEAS